MSETKQLVDLEELPRGWKLASLKQHVRSKSGSSKIIKGKQASQPGDGLVQGFSASGPDVWVEEVGYDEAGVAVSAVGARCGKTFLAEPPWTAIANTHALVPDDEINVRFLWHLTNREDWWIKSGTAQPFVKVKDTLERPTLIPSLPEQERIVEILEDQLSRLDTALQSVHTVREKAAQFRRSLLHAAFTGALIGHDVEEGELPSGWALCKFNEIANVDSNLVDPKPFGHLPHIAPNNIEGGSGRLLDYRSTAEDGVTSGKHKFHRGHILYSKIRPYLNKVVVVDFEGLCSADMYPISTDQNINWLFMTMLGPSFVSQTSSTQTRTVLPKINIKELSRIEIPVPPLPEQERIVEILEEQLSRLDASLAVAGAVEERSAALRRSLLHSAFTGRLTEGWREAVNV